MEAEIEDCKIDTAHNRIYLQTRGDRLELRSADGAMQSAIDLTRPYRLALKNLEHMVGILLFMPKPARILLLGTAAGSLLHFLQHYLDAEITALDIDAVLVDRLLRLGILPPAQPGLSYVFDDAAHYIKHCEDTFDLILVDVFHGAQTPPWILDKKCSEQLFARLSEAGGLAYNLLIDSENDFKRFYRDLRLVFTQRTLCLPVAGLENSIAYAFRHASPGHDMNQLRQQALQYSEQFELDFMQILAVIYNTNPVGSGML